ncbi:MAG: hypothetical protein GF411_13985 [Candidatus Lokiarchaeota archaeon]|nr:hypothetical protein [Candidatus Lokiarchaeota archaeon]
MATPYSVGERINRKLRKTLKKRINPNNEGDGDGQRMRLKSLRGKVAPKKSGNHDPNRKPNMDEAIKFIAKYHGQDVGQIIEQVEDRTALARLARKMMAINFRGWHKDGDQVVFGEGEVKLPSSQWAVTEDSRLKSNSETTIDNEWLYKLAILAEQDDKATIEQNNSKGSLDPKDVGSMLSKAGSILHGLDNNRVMNYLEDAIRSEKNTEEAAKQRSIWESTGINWRLEGVELLNDDVAMKLKVKYSSDGTQEGVTEKILTVRLQNTPETDLK